MPREGPVSLPWEERRTRASSWQKWWMRCILLKETERGRGRVLDACVLQIWHKAKSDSHLEETHYPNVSLRGWNWNKIPWCQENICYRSVLSIRYWDGWRLLTFSPNVWEKRGGALEELQGEGEGTERRHVQYSCIKFSENKKVKLKNIGGHTGNENKQSTNNHLMLLSIPNCPRIWIWGI